MLALTSDRRLPSAPETPTLQELGYKEFFQVAWWGVFAPASTPKSVVSTLEQSLQSAFTDDEGKEYLLKNNFSSFTRQAPMNSSDSRKRRSSGKAGWWTSSRFRSCSWRCSRPAPGRVAR